MKQSLILISILAASSHSAIAASNAGNPHYKYCDNITQVNKLLDRTRESVERIRAEGQPIERVLISKDRKEMYLISGETVFRKYTVALGVFARGHKQFQGDRKTPEGIYSITNRNPNSKFHLSLGVSYPNKKDIAFARSKGKSAGGDIMIHGLPNPGPGTELIYDLHPMNWTQGCIAVTNEEIREVWKLVPSKTLVEICKMSDLPQKPASK